MTKRQPLMANHLERLAFIDEPSVKTNMARTTGWAPRGPRLVDHAPFGHWPTQTFIGALRHDRLDAPRVIDGAMNGEMFDRYVAAQLVPTLRAGDVVILDNLSSHKNPSAAQTLREIGAGFLFLPPYSPVFSLGIWWIGFRMKRSGSDVQILQMYSYGVRPLSVFNLRTKL